MKKESSVDELQPLFDAYLEKTRLMFKKQKKMLKKEIETLKEEIEVLKEKLNTRPLITEYDKALMDYGLIDENFYALESAPKIAEFLIDHMQMDKLKPDIIQRYKIQEKEKPFTLNTARKAVTAAKSR